MPRESFDHPQLPRLWARARVDALLEKIERDGEDQATIDEIIRLARQYKFVTPYTSFLAVPRALLRPRVIRPGDPVLRVKTDESIVSVVALFPFGLVQPLRYLSSEDIWQTRFLAPTDMQDGTYTVRLILRDRPGHDLSRVEDIRDRQQAAGRPDEARRKRFQRGQTIDLKVQRFAEHAHAGRAAGRRGAGRTEVESAGGRQYRRSLLIPEQTIPGTYKLTVTAEDIAHNIGTQEVQIEVLP